MGRQRVKVVGTLRGFSVINPPNPVGAVSKKVVGTLRVPQLDYQSLVGVVSQPHRIFLIILPSVIVLWRFPFFSPIGAICL